MAKKKSFEGKDFAVIGKLKHYEGIADIKDRIEADRGKCSSKITMKKDFVICNNPEKYADKLKDAYEFEIPIISELSFIKTFDRLSEWYFTDKEKAEIMAAPDVIIDSRKKKLKSITFGQYSYSETLVPLKWLVLDQNGDDLLLLCEKTIESLPYNKEEKSITWETSFIRSWLNNDFYNIAFTKNEKNRIISKTIVNKDNRKIPGGVNTQDNLFLLSLNEVKKYLPLAIDRICGSFNPSTDKNSFWWLRSPGMNSSCAAWIWNDGTLVDTGTSVDFRLGCVRPAMWIKK